MASKFQVLPSLLLSALVLAPDSLSAQSSPYRGLWVGEAVLGEVNEVTVPLDDQNIPRAPDPDAVTPTSDAASLRLILHVDATGQVSLLKHVAILARKSGIQEAESDLALVTDPSLYGVFPPQPATRISSIAFDFGDANATGAVDELVERSATAAADAAVARGATLANVTDAAERAASPVLVEADSEAAFTSFLQEHLDAGAVRAIANGGPSTDARAAATALQGDSFVGDVRGVEMVDAIDAVLAALPASATAIERETAALNTAAAFVETNDDYNRFLVGELFGDMISRAAEEAAVASRISELKPIDSILSAEGGAAIHLVSSAHGVTTGDEVAIQGAAIAGYNGVHKVGFIDGNTIRIGVSHVPGASIENFSAHQQVGPLRLTSIGHGLGDGDRITLQGSLESYNGSHLVTVIDDDTISLDLPFESNPGERGIWYIRSGQISGFQGADDGSAGVKVVSRGHGLDNGQSILIEGAGSASYNGLKSVTRIDDDSFLIDQAFDGDPSEKGGWILPVAINEFRPPADLPTLVESASHGLTTGDRVLVSGSGNPLYNREFVVTVDGEDAFSIPVTFSDAEGNPAVAGSWVPAGGGKWRPASTVRDAVTALSEVDDARAEALRIKVTPYDDSRAPDAVEQVLEAVIRAAALVDESEELQAGSVADQAGREALASVVARYARPSSIPSRDYSEFVKSSSFEEGVATASAAAAAAALKEKDNLLATPDSIVNQARAAAIQALTPLYSEAARSLLTALPMTGGLEPGGSGLQTEIVLPANHPTNPFRHRRHPDHTVGFDIRRVVNLEFGSGDGGSLARAGYGVDRISGVYEEEIFGLHKPLGPSRDGGLKVRGRFQLQRISLIDTLNGR